MRKLLIVVFCLLFFSAYLQADDHEAASLSYADIQTAVDAADPGDRVILPAGTNSDWSGSDEVLIVEAITIIGQGPGNTIIELSSTNQSGEGRIFCFDGISGSIGFSGIKLVGLGDPAYQDRGLQITDCDDSTVRIWNCVFEDLMANAVVVQGYPLQGVIWNCSIKNSNYAGLGYGVYVNGRRSGDDEGGDASWDDPADLGGSNNFFIEDCALEQCRHDVDGSLGGRYVVRYNTIIGNGLGSNAVINVHGPSAVNRGLKSFEVYENVITFVTGQYGVYPRSGEGVVWGNTFIDISYVPYSFILAHPCCTTSCSEYPEKDQIYDMYIWGNTVNGDSYNEGYVASFCGEWELFIEDRDWFESEKPEYTPYTYPHPLRSEVEVAKLRILGVLHINDVLRIGGN